MLLRKLVVVGLAGIFSLAANIATAEDAVGPTASFIGASGVSFADPADAFSDRFTLDLGAVEEARFARLSPANRSARSDRGFHGYEVALTTSAVGDFDVSFAQRGGVGFNREGNVDRERRSSELRIGRGLNMRRDQPSSGAKWYFFAASEDEALIWQPGQRTDFGNSGGGFALQDRVEVGDLQAGVTYEANGWQASLAYVEREISVRSGHRTYTEDEDFAGFTLTMRH